MARTLEDRLERARDQVHANPSPANIKLYKQLADELTQKRSAEREGAPSAAVAPGDVAVRPEAVAGGISVQPEEGEVT